MLGGLERAGDQVGGWGGKGRKNGSLAQGWAVERRGEGPAQATRGQGPVPAPVRPREGGTHVSGPGQLCGLSGSPEG